jgi:hypothetical protein
MVYQGITFQGIRYSLFHYNTSGTRGGFADFDRFGVDEPTAHGLTRPIPYGQIVNLRVHKRPQQSTENSGEFLLGGKPAKSFVVLDQGLGRVALKDGDGVVSVDDQGRVSVKTRSPGRAETFQWIETFTGELVLLSLETDRYLDLDPETKTLSATSIGPTPDEYDGVRFDWELSTGHR